MSLFSFLNSTKDLALEVAVKLWFNQSQHRLGTMTSIQIDSTAKRIHVELSLKGESSPLTVNVDGYSLSDEAGETFIQLGRIDTSREWVNVLLADYVKPENRRFPVPSALKILL
jgi:hypothetical protein